MLPDAEAVAERVAQLLLEERLLRPERPLGLATGRTMEPVYRALGRAFLGQPAVERQRLRSQWLSFNLDEYVGLAPDHPGSFAATMATALVAPLDLDPRRVHLPSGLDPDPQREAERYGQALANEGGIGLQLLGLGLNGHVGFNEPPCGPMAACRCVELQPGTREANAPAFGGDPAAVPALAITLGLREILEARKVVLVVTGAAKAGVLRRFLDQPPTPDLPASWLHGHPAVQVIVDREALGNQ